MAATLEPSAPLLTEDLISGLNEGKVLPSDVGVTIPGVSADNARQFAYELIRAAVHGKLGVDKLPVAVKCSGLEATPALQQQVADVLWYMWLEVEGASEGEDKERLQDVVKAAQRERLVTKPLLLEVGEGEFLEWCGLVPGKEVWRKKEIRANTRHSYQQHKFNLLREESEGYSKMLTLLNQVGPGVVTQANTQEVLAEMKALIGYFDLDPNRVFSLVLEAITMQPQNDGLLGLVPAFSSEAVNQMCGFHFDRCKGKQATTPPGLYTAAAKLIKAGYVTLEALMAHLSPADDDLKAAYAEGSKQMGEAVARIGRISLTSNEPEPPKGGGGRGGGGGGDAQHDELTSRRPGLSAELLELDGKAYVHYLTDVTGANNQNLGLLAALLRTGDWPHAVTLMRWLRALGVSDFAIFPAVGAALCQLAGQELAPLYRAIYPHGYRSPAGEYPKGLESLQLTPRLLELLRLIGVHLYHDVPVLTHLVRVMAGLIYTHKGLPAPHSAAVLEQAVDILTASALPAMHLLPSHISLVFEIWDALVQLPYTQRFSIYGDVSDMIKSSPLLTASSKLAETEVRRILRRVTAPASRKEAKTAMRPLGRCLAKIMHAAPIAVSEQLIRQVMGMPGMVGSIVESLKYITPMATDVMLFVIIRHLASPKKKLKADGVNLEEWFQWLAAFTGLFCKKHQDVELAALLQYVANQLKSTESLDLLVLKEVLTAMTGIQAVFDVSDTQLDALAGSETLRIEVVTQGEHRSSSKSLRQGTQRLIAALRQGKWEDQLALPLLILLAQQRKLITLTTQSTHLKLIAEQYDKCQEVVTQYAEFLRHALSAQDYAALLPSIQDLALDYRVDPEIIFELHRPMLRLVEPPSAPPLRSGAAQQAQHGPEEGELPDAEPAAEEAGAANGTDADKGGVEKPEEEGVKVEAEKEDGEAPMEEEGEVVGEAAPSSQLANGNAAALAVDTDARWPELVEQVCAVVGDGSGLKAISPTLYLTFWSLGLYDLEVPTQRYESTTKQLNTNMRVAQEDIGAAKRAAERPPPSYGYGGYGGHGGGYGRGPPPPPMEAPQVDVDQLEKDLERYKAAVERLPGDLRKQQENAAVIEKRLQRTKGAWIVGETVEEKHAGQKEYSVEFVQHCLLPRVLNSPSDALYCARFLQKVHQLDVPGFSLLHVLQQLLREVGFLVRCCTPREATNLGIFLNELLGMIEHWRGVYARECATSHAFFEARKKKAQLSLNEYKHLLTTWQEKLTDDVFSSCLRSGDYMQMKNALLVLNRCVKVYPPIRSDAEALIHILSPVREKDPREDLKTLARMYCTALEMQMREKSRVMYASRDAYAGRKPKSSHPAKSALAPSASAAAAGEGNKAATPMLPPGMGMMPPGVGIKKTGGAASGGEDAARPGSPSGPPPGFGTTPNMPHAVSSSDVRKAEGGTAKDSIHAKPEGAAPSSRPSSRAGGAGSAEKAGAGGHRGESSEGAGSRREREAGGARDGRDSSTARHAAAAGERRGERPRSGGERGRQGEKERGEGREGKAEARSAHRPPKPTTRAEPSGRHAEKRPRGDSLERGGAVDAEEPSSGKGRLGQQPQQAQQEQRSTGDAGPTGKSQLSAFAAPFEPNAKPKEEPASSQQRDAKRQRTEPSAGEAKRQSAEGAVAAGNGAAAKSDGGKLAAGAGIAGAEAPQKGRGEGEAAAARPASRAATAGKEQPRKGEAAVASKQAAAAPAERAGSANPPVASAAAQASKGEAVKAAPSSTRQRIPAPSAEGSAGEKRKREEEPSHAAGPQRPSSRQQQPPARQPAAGPAKEGGVTRRPTGERPASAEGEGQQPKPRLAAPTAGPAPQAAKGELPSAGSKPEPAGTAPAKKAATGEALAEARAAARAAIAAKKSPTQQQQQQPQLEIGRDQEGATPASKQLLATETGAREAKRGRSPKPGGEAAGSSRGGAGVRTAPAQQPLATSGEGSKARRRSRSSERERSRRAAATPAQRRESAPAPVPREREPAPVAAAPRSRVESRMEAGAEGELQQPRARDDRARPRPAPPQEPELLSLEEEGHPPAQQQERARGALRGRVERQHGGDGDDDEERRAVEEWYRGSEAVPEVPARSGSGSESEQSRSARKQKRRSKEKRHKRHKERKEDKNESSKGKKSRSRHGKEEALEGEGREGTEGFGASPGRSLSRQLSMRSGDQEQQHQQQGQREGRRHMPLPAPSASGGQAPRLLVPMDEPEAKRRRRAADGGDDYWEGRSGPASAAGGLGGIPARLKSRLSGLPTSGGGGGGDGGGGIERRASRAANVGQDYKDTTAQVEQAPSRARGGSRVVYDAEEGRGSKRSRR